MSMMRQIIERLQILSGFDIVVFLSLFTVLDCLRGQGAVTSSDEVI